MVEYEKITKILSEIYLILFRSLNNFISYTHNIEIKRRTISNRERVSKYFHTPR